MIDIASLQTFKAVVEEGGINAAARKLYRVQSSVTTRIQQLEATLGVALFIRENRRLTLSPAGEIFLGYAEQMLFLSEQAHHAVLGDPPRGVLRLGTLESTAASRLPPLLSKFHQTCPAVRVELATNTSDALVEEVIRRKHEAAFVAGHPKEVGLEALAVFDEELVIVAPRSHPDIVCAQDVQADTIISFPAGCAYRRLLQAWLVGGDVVPQMILELSSYHAIVACVASGTGIAIVPRAVLETVRVNDSIAVYPLSGEQARLKTHLIWRKGEASPAFKALRSQVLESVSM